jgi:putative two-component system response regulator
MECFRAGATDVLTLETDYIEIYVRLMNIMQRWHYAKRIELERVGLGLEVLRRSDLLDETRLEITRLLGRAAEYRDNETGRHVVRVSKLCELVCRALSLRHREAMLIAHASPLHDIGKIGVPDAILLKNGKLTDGERRIMRRHTLIGARILASSNDPLLFAAKQIALNHHEHWNGGGYPRHVRGDRIPLSARVVAVCDVFDALTSRRPYKEPWSFDAAFEYVESQSGMQFDPRVAAAFLEVANEAIEVAMRYAEPDADTTVLRIGETSNGD